MSGLDSLRANWNQYSTGVETAVADTNEPPKTEEQTQVQDTVEPPVSAEVKPEQKVETQPPVQEQKQETPNPDTPEQPELPVIDLGAVKDAPMTYPPDSLGALAQKFNINGDIKTHEDFVKAHSEKYVPKEELIKNEDEYKTKVYSKLKPEVAAALELRQILPPDIPDEYILNPTGDMDYLLSMQDADLVKELITRGNAGKLTEEDINYRVEKLIEEGNIDKEAKIARVNITGAKTKLLQERDQLVNNIKQQQAQAEQLQKQEQDTMFKKALDEVQTFMGVPVSEKQKQDVLAKYQSGGYGSALDKAKNMVAAIFQHEFGDTIAKHLTSKVKSETKEEVHRKLSDVPPKTAAAGSSKEIKDLSENKKPLGSLHNWRGDGG